MKTKQFKLRNGMIVEENKRGETVANAAGYIDDYVVISEEEGRYGHKQGERICLALWQSDWKGRPTGGSLGSDYDVMEEVTPE